MIAQSRRLIARPRQLLARTEQDNRGVVTGAPVLFCRALNEVSVLVSAHTMRYRDNSGTSGKTGGFHNWIKFLSPQTKTPRGALTWYIRRILAIWDLTTLPFIARGTFSNAQRLSLVIRSYQGCKRNMPAYRLVGCTGGGDGNAPRRTQARQGARSPVRPR